MHLNKESPESNKRTLDLKYTLKHPQFNNLPYKFGDFDKEPEVKLMEQQEISHQVGIPDEVAYALFQDLTNNVIFELGDKNPNKPPKKKTKKKLNHVDLESPVKKPRKKRKVTS